jgi:hypothetical protein
VSPAAGSNGLAKALTLPGSPVSPAAACLSASTKQVVVTWVAVPLATSYTIYRSSTSGTSGFGVTATGVTVTTWTSATLANGNYWFAVAAVIGSNWTGPMSAATGETTTQSSSPQCKQP